VCCSTFRYDDRTGSAALRGSNDRTKVVRVLYAVEQNEDRVMRDSAYEVVGIGIARGGSDCENALVIRAMS